MRKITTTILALGLVAALAVPVFARGGYGMGGGGMGGGMGGYGMGGGRGHHMGMTAEDHDQWRNEHRARNQADCPYFSQNQAGPGTQIGPRGRTGFQQRGTSRQQ